jgi:hypothetical protein
MVWSERFEPIPVATQVAEELAAAALWLARCFHAGATLWVVSPRGAPYARHLADQFAHPATPGARVLPSVAVVGPDLVVGARAACRSGDVLTLVAGAEDPVALDLSRRSRAWGVGTIWTGVGDRPGAGSADHVLWVDSRDPTVPDGIEVLHQLLWERTQDCLQHPDRLDVEAPVCGTPHDPACLTCADEGRLVEVVEAPSLPFAPALVRSPDGVEEIDVTLVGEVRPGDLVLVHAGSALTLVGVR